MLYRLIDTHAHICDPVFDPDREPVLKRAREAGVAAVIAVSETLADSERNLELSMEHPMLLPAAGLSPVHLDTKQAEAVASLVRSLAESPGEAAVVSPHATSDVSNTGNHRVKKSRFWGIGEVGLDFWKVQEERDTGVQEEIFRHFIRLALELDLPLNVHSRSAGRRVIDLLLKQGVRKAQLHAFDGKASSAKPAIEAGYYFSIPASIVRSQQKQKLVRSLPLSSLLVETDSPVLGAMREERNEPARIFSAASAIAELKKVPVDKVFEVLWENTCRLYIGLEKFIAQI